MTQHDKQLIKAIHLLLKDLNRNAISKEHRKSDLEIDCPECQFRILEAYLRYYKDIIECDEKLTTQTTKQALVPFTTRLDPNTIKSNLYHNRN